LSPDRVQRLAGIASIFVLASMLVAGYYAWNLHMGSEVVQKWLPAESPSRIAYADFARRFGDSQALVFSWQDANLEDPRVDQATDFLQQRWEENPDWPVKALFNSKQAVQRLQQSLRRASFEQSIQRLSGQAVGKDGASIIVLQLEDPSPEQRDQIISACLDAAASVQISPSDIVLAGEPYQTHEIDRYSRLSVERYVPLSMVLCLGFAWICLRSWRMTLMVMAFAGVGQLIGMALISATIGQMGAILIVVPTLLFMLTLSAGVHLTNYLMECRKDGRAFPGLRALQMGFFPCAIAAITTSFGFGSLALSELEPVFQFGALAAGGMVLSTVVLLILFVPATRLANWRDRGWASPSVAGSWVTEMLLRIVQGGSWWIVVGGLILFAVCLTGLPRLGATTRFDGMFADSHPAVRSLRWVEEKLGPTETLEFLISFPESPESADVLEQLAVVQSLQAVLVSHDQVHSAFSATCVLPPLPQQTGTRATIRRAVFRRLLSDELDQLAAAELVCQTDGGICWRLTARFKSYIDSDFHRLSEELTTLVGSELALFQPDRVERPMLQVTGLRTVIEAANAILLRDLAGSFAMAFLLITPFMMLVVRSIPGGLILMLPNVVPVVLIFGSMGWLSIPLDVASILTASVALGIAVDDTLHCVVWYLRGRQAGDSASEAAAQAIRRCARPMFHTTLICSGAMLPFLFCEFLPTGKFALLLILILLSAILSDLFFLPSILCSPLGRWIGGRSSGSQIR
jgi:uncharacterized protein